MQSVFLLPRHWAIQAELHVRRHSGVARVIAFWKDSVMLEKITVYPQWVNPWQWVHRKEDRGAGRYQGREELEGDWKRDD